MTTGSGRAPSGQALVASDEARSDLHPSGFDPSRIAEIERLALRIETSPLELLQAVETFVRESNRIEGIKISTSRHKSAHWMFLRGPVTIPALIELVGHLQPDARFRNQTSIPGVRVGTHIAPPSGPDIEGNLRSIIAMRDPWEQHIAYETLHPFTDGNGRSGRAIWLHRHFHEPTLDRWAVRRGFLHSFYYHTLGSVRFASGIDTRSAIDSEAGVARKGESPTPKGDAQT